MSLELATKNLNELSHAEVESYLKALWSMQLRLDDVDVSADFINIGGQSVDMFRMLARLEEDFDLEIDFDDFFETPTLSVLHQLLININA